MTDQIHSPDVCRKAFAALRSGYTEAILIDMSAVPDDFANAVLAENIICTGGASRQVICHGDTDGPTFTRLDDGRAQVVCVTSFGFGVSYCMLGPDFSTRVAFHADRIKEQMTTKFNTCRNYDSSTSFASNPPSQLSTDWTTSRCVAGKWQCLSGECIDLSRVRDGSNFACADQSDEQYTYDSVSLCSGTARRLEEAVRPSTRPFMTGDEKRGYIADSLHHCSLRGEHSNN
jgi:hypothetical protein